MARKNGGVMDKYDLLVLGAVVLALVCTLGAFWIADAISKEIWPG
jgi:hypothetical protein